LVVVGDLIGEGSTREQSVVGETPNLAARLQALAEPSSVVIAAGTRRLLGVLFEYRDLGAVEVKGITAPVPAWQVLRPSAVESRFEALRGSTLTPLIGRGEEIDLLLRRWARAKTGAGQAVLISGEPGIGKSPITAELEGHLHAEPAEPQPAAEEERTLEALLRQLQALARLQPVLMIFEDAHWIDPTSRELLDLTIERLRGLPALLVATFRPEFQPSWAGQPHATMLTLNRLDWHDRSALIAQIAGGKALPDEVVDQIVERTDGVPFDFN
jgi:hypothetical protein